MPTVERIADVCAECGQVVVPPAVSPPPPPERWLVQYFLGDGAWGEKLCSTQESMSDWCILCIRDRQPYRVCHIPGAKADE